MNGERLLLDTTFVVGYLNPRDQHHSNALKCMPRVEKALDVVVTEAVLIHDDKDWGLTDCISFVVMRDHGLTIAATADNDFQQAGFRALMIEPL